MFTFYRSIDSNTLRSGRAWRSRDLGPGSRALGGNHRCSYPPGLHGICRRELAGFICLLSLSFPFSFPLSFLWCSTHFLGRGLGGGQRGACNVSPLRGLRTGNGLYIQPCPKKMRLAPRSRNERRASVKDKGKTKERQRKEEHRATPTPFLRTP